jgi:hypothetical protein
MADAGDSPTPYEWAGGYHRMVGKHRDLAITPEQRCDSPP